MTDNIKKALTENLWSIITAIVLIIASWTTIKITLSSAVNVAVETKREFDIFKFKTSNDITEMRTESKLIYAEMIRRFDRLENKLDRK